MPPSKKKSRTTAPADRSAKRSSPQGELTGQQAAAIHHRRTSTVLSAGAGCGKTFVLTRRFLSHLAPGAGALDLSQLVAITFTERAAREMRDRIRKECRRILRKCDESEVDYWLTIVRQLDTARISTIHSFCGSLLRSCAVEAALDPRFNLLDETTSRSLLRTAVTEGLCDLVAARNADSHELVLELGLDRTVSLLETLVLARYRIDFGAWRDRPPANLAAEWEELWKTVARPRFLRELLESTTAVKLAELFRKHVPNQDLMRERRQALLDGLAALRDSDNPLIILSRMLSNARVDRTGGKKAWDDDVEVYANVKAELDDLRELIKDTLDQWEYQEGDLIPAAEAGLRLLRVTEQAGRAYDEQKRAGGWLDFDDLLIGARNLLRDHPEVRRRVAAGISLLLVDEFQDTDPIQKEIVAALCGEELLTGKLFVVGDVKQSIYRFRRAEPRVFRQLRQDIPEEGRLPLTMNFRSQPAILNFVNVLFDGSLGAEYEPLVPSCEQLSEEPSIELLFATASLDTDDPDQIDESAAGLRRREATWIARRLKQLLHDGKPRVRDRDAAGGRDSLRALKQKDIVILFRAMTDVRYYEEALREAGLDYYVVGGHSFFAQQEVLDLANLCRALDDPDDEVSLIGVLRSPFFSLSDDALLALARQRTAGAAAGEEPISLAQALDVPPPAWLSEAQKERLTFAGRVFAELRPLKDHIPLARILSLAVERTGYDAALLMEFLGARKLANLRKLIDLARQFDQTGLFTLSDFVERLQESIGEEVKEALAATHPESSDVIRLMSIHQSKGLEFPLVVLADMDRKTNDPSPSAEFDPELGPLVSLPEKYGEKRENLGLKLLRLKNQDENLAELLRLFYVAATRAGDHLILSAGVKRGSKFKHPWMLLLAERFDLLTGQPRLAPTSKGHSPFAKYQKRIPEIHIHRACPAPEPTAGQPHQPRGSLKALRETLATIPPTPLPESIAPIAVDLSARRRLSVSEIRQADALLHGHDAMPLDRADEPEPHRNADAANLPVANPPTGGDDARQLGDLVHLVLERIDRHSPGNADELVAALAGQMPGTVSRDVLSMAGECVQTMLASPAFAAMAAAERCDREIEFYLPWPLPDTAAAAPASIAPRLIVGKLDCLLKSADGMRILDYKTGRIPPGRSPTHVLADYEMQLAIYALAVRQLTGAWPIRSELVLLRHGAERVGFDPRDAPWETLTSRINRAIAAILGQSVPDAAP